MAQVLCHLKLKENKLDPNLIVGLDTSDDAGVYKINEDTALIQTLDFFTPVVDDPYMFGQIAAANALSDVYAMGGKPLTAMNICCFATCLDPEVLAEILRGGADKIVEAGAVLVGGHTVTDNEVKYGLSVTGHIHPSKVLANAGAKVGDVLILTKPVGTGILTTALKRELIDEAGLAEAVKSMSTLNKGAAQAMERVGEGVHGCTDITGFGVMGHVYEMASGSEVTIELTANDVELFDRTLELIDAKAVPGGARSNEKHFSKWVDMSDAIPENMQTALYDPQTSGGLLIAVETAKAEALVKALKEEGCLCATPIGHVVAKSEDDVYIKVK